MTNIPDYKESPLRRRLHRESRRHRLVVRVAVDRLHLGEVGAVPELGDHLLDHRDVAGQHRLHRAVAAVAHPAVAAQRRRLPLGPRSGPYTLAPPGNPNTHSGDHLPSPSPLPLPPPSTQTPAT